MHQGGSCRSYDCRGKNGTHVRTVRILCGRPCPVPRGLVYKLLRSFPGYARIFIAPVRFACAGISLRVLVKTLRGSEVKKPPCWFVHLSDNSSLFWAKSITV